MKALVLSLAVLLVGILVSNFDTELSDWIIFHPERAHYTSEDFLSATSGKLFEGWYYKIASSDRQIAIIPGAYHSDHESYAFIMVVTSEYSREYRYPLSSYVIPEEGVDTFPGQFHIRIADNNFSRTHVELNLRHSDLRSVQPSSNNTTPKGFGDIKGLFKFTNMDRGFPVSLGFLGAMGYYGWIPFLECYHGILAMNFNVDGWVQFPDSPQLDMINYNGYLEKDWGTNFPQTWIWLQGNSFEGSPGTSLTLALARLPIVGDSVLTKFGFLGGFYYEGELHQFGTYTWASVTNLVINDTDPYRTISISISNLFGTKRLEVSTSVPLSGYQPGRSSYPLLMVPSPTGRMLPQLIEWVNASLTVTFYYNNKVHRLYSSPATVECHSPDDTMQYMKEVFPS